MLCDYAHERWAASRPVSPELWRCVGPHATGAALQDLEKVLKQGTEPERKAAALALRARAIRPQPRCCTAIRTWRGAAGDGKLTWEAVRAGAA